MVSDWNISMSYQSYKNKNGTAQLRCAHSLLKCALLTPPYHADDPLCFFPCSHRRQWPRAWWWTTSAWASLTATSPRWPRNCRGRGIAWPTSCALLAWSLWCRKAATSCSLMWRLSVSCFSCLILKYENKFLFLVASSCNGWISFLNLQGLICH